MEMLVTFIHKRISIKLDKIVKGIISSHWSRIKKKKQDLNKWRDIYHVHEWKTKMAILQLANRFEAITIKNPSWIFGSYQ